jgi:hypothetical protein
VSYFIFAGDMLVMGFMVVLVVWVSLRAPAKHFDAVARIPLEEDRTDG